MGQLQTGDPITNPSESALDVELYKHLRAESHHYLTQIPDLWVKKLTLLSVLVTTLLFNKDLPGDYRGPALVFVLVALPIFSALLDAKVLEFALQARLISRFIEREFALDGSKAERWERVLWGNEQRTAENEQPTSYDLVTDVKLAQSRTRATAAMAVLPTALIMIVSAVVGCVLVIKADLKGPPEDLALGTIVLATVVALAVLSAFTQWALSLLSKDVFDPPKKSKFELALEESERKLKDVRQKLEKREAELEAALAKPSGPTEDKPDRA